MNKQDYMRLPKERLAELLAERDAQQPSKGLDVTDFCKPIDPGIAQCIADHWWEMLDDEPTPSKKCEKTEESALKKCEEADLEEAADESWTMYEYKDSGNLYSSCYKDGFFAGAQWQKKQDTADMLKSDFTVFNKCYEQGKEDMKKQMMEWANSWLAFKRSGIVLDDGFSYAMEELIKKLNEM